MCVGGGGSLGGGGCMTFYDFLFAFPFKKGSTFNREENLLLEE